MSQHAYPSEEAATSDALIFSRMNMYEDRPLYVVVFGNTWVITSTVPGINQRTVAIALNGVLFRRDV